MSRSVSQKLVFATAILVLGWLSIRYFLPICLPFFLGAFLALAAQPAAGLLRHRLHLPHKMAAVASVLVVFLLSGTLLVFALGVLMRQLGHLQAALPQIEQAATDGMAMLQQQLRIFSQQMPAGIRATLQRLTETDATGTLLTDQALQKIPQLVSGLVEYLSAGMFGLVTGILSGCMISIRLPQWKQFLRRRLPPVWQERYVPAMEGIRAAFGGWLLAQAKLAGITFVLLLAGFFLLRIPNTLLFALLITILDAFPVLGVGTILIPWSLVCLLQSDPVTGFGLLGLYGVIWLIRSALEPKLVGQGIGLDPLVTLVSIYAGWKLMGILGMLLAPILALAAVQAVKAIRQEPDTSFLQR